MNDAYIINDFLSKGAQHNLLPRVRSAEAEKQLSSKQMGTQSRTDTYRLGVQSYLRP